MREQTFTDGLAMPEQSKANSGGLKVRCRAHQSQLVEESAVASVLGKVSLIANDGLFVSGCCNLVVDVLGLY